MARAMARNTKVKGKTSCVAMRRAALVPRPASVAKVATTSRSLRQETARPNRGKVRRRAAAVQVEMAWKLVVASKINGESTRTEVSPCSAASRRRAAGVRAAQTRSEEHTSELQSLRQLV